MSPLTWCKGWEPMLQSLQSKIKFNDSKSPRIHIAAQVLTSCRLVENLCFLWGGGWGWWGEWGGIPIECN